MSLTGRSSAFFLAALGVVLAGFSITMYISAHVYLERQVGERAVSALAVLAAAAEVHPDGVEWEPQERILPLGQDAGAERLRWQVFDDRGVRIDHSRNCAVAARMPDASVASRRWRDREGRAWRVSRRVIVPDGARRDDEPSAPDATERLHAALTLTVCVPLDPMEAMLAALAWFLAGLSGALWLLAALVCRWLSRRALRPLAELAAAARGLDVNDPGWRLRVAGTGDELDDLGQAFNEMLARLHRDYERQQRFGRDASHQLRTPLTVLIGQLEVALRHERSGEEYRRALRTALGRAVQLSRIVEALLFLGRAEGESRLPDGEPLELGGWVAAQLAERRESGRLPLINYEPGADDALWVRAHPALLGQLLDNLLENAERHGGTQSPIRVEARRDDQDAAVALLAVEDAGPGIPREDFARVFEPFYRCRPTLREGAPGAGLGLSVVARIATAFGGAARVVAPKGTGCRVEVRLPITNGNARS